MLQVPSKKVGLGWVPGGSSHTEPEQVRLEPTDLSRGSAPRLGLR